MKYRNNITNKKTEYKYRFRTEEEFIDEFGHDWHQDISCTWNLGGMDFLFGKDLELTDSDGDEIYNNHDILTINDIINLNRLWSISSDMIIPNVKLDFGSIYLKNKQNVYENKKGDF